VTLEQVNRSARTYLVPDQRSVVTTVPAKAAADVTRKAP
jgi:predicted Zn-dependent peptidase